MHVPSNIDASVLPNAQQLVFAVVPSIDAGASATDNIAGEDRDRTVDVGNSVDSINFACSVRSTSASGLIAYVCFKLERKLSVPVVAFDTIPSNASATAIGIQQAWRILNPGRVLKYGKIAYTLETTRVFNVQLSLAKFKMSKIRPGDYVGICFLNQGSASARLDTEMRYKSYT